MIEENAKSKITARDAARLEKQRKLAEVLRAKADAEEMGVDVERDKNWEWTIEENDAWEKKKARKARRADFEFHGAPYLIYLHNALILMCLCLDDAHAARRRYKKDLDLIKPDMAAYNRQKELAMGLPAGSLTNFNPKAGSSSMQARLYMLSINLNSAKCVPQIVPTNTEQRLAAENLYRDANTLIYGDSKPTEDAIDRVVEKINKE